VEPTVLLENAFLGYRGEPVLGHVNLAFSAGELVGVVGRSGAGKSTLLGALSGERVQLSGSIRVAGKDPVRSSNPVGLVPQLGDEVLTQLAVSEVVALGAPRRGLFTSRTERTGADALLARLGLDGLQRRRLGELSGGQRQRVAIARALSASQTLLLCDEPTSGADPALTAEIIGVLQEIAETGTTVVVATHDLAVVAPRLTRLVGIGGGTVRYDGPASSFGSEEQSDVYGSEINGRSTS
jgi:ABC-type Mn2+/Zn2+ transport system ATPase subunit